MAKKFPGSAIFQHATRSIRDAARREFAQTPVGRFVQEARRAGASGATMKAQLAHLFRAIEGRPGAFSRDMRSSGSVRQVMQQVERYAKGGVERVAMNLILNQLGPLGNVVRAIMSVGRTPSNSLVQKELDAAAALLRSFGYHVTPPRHQRTTEDAAKLIEAAKDVLNQAGYRVVGPEKEKELFPSLGARQLPFGTPELTKRGRKRRTVLVKTPDGTRRFSVDHPAITGQNVLTPQSSNVYSFRYNIETGNLYVRFKAPADKGGARPNAPGPLYEYSGVTATEFKSLIAAPSKGTWVWDSLRIRGTVAGYQKPYRLAGITGNYVPRHAVLKIGRQGLGEYYAPRTFNTSARSFRSDRGEQLVRALRPRDVVRRGAPNRGAPNTGKP